MASLTGTKIKDTYDGLLKTTDNAGIGATAKQLTDGLGTGSPIYVATDFVGIGTNTQTVNGEDLRIAGDVFINSTGSATVPTIAVADANSGIFAPSAGNIAIATQGTEQLLINNAGNAFFTKGIFLNGDTASANQLNDYEEGTFTPQIFDASTGGNQATIGAANGVYTKIGRLVTVSIQCSNIDTTGMTSTNGMYFKNLPFAIAGQSGSPYYVGGVRFNNITTSANCLQLSPFGVDNSDYIQLDEVFNNGTASGILKVNQLTSGVSDIWITVTYFA